MLTDKRVIKTRAGIKTALMLLTLEKEIAKITISNLTEKAQINRSTFYLHYSSIADVTDDIEKEINARISSCIDNFNYNDIYGSTCDMFTKLTNVLNENVTMKNYILYSTSSDYIIGRIKEILVDKTMTAVLAQYPQYRRQDFAYTFTFLSAGIIDSYIKWAHSENKEVTLEELIKTVSSLVNKTLVK
ncbi:MAG: TetR/AcrR family transcriptional regulator C-terminal domain-containing protein [Clostridia bacterium]|nr:TetR/AcrR family transcriptional regulator C-terminal domain-containing protein [Clostridia bacterium]